MMNNLFSIFDPSNYFNIQISWLLMLSGLLLFPSLFWVFPSRASIILSKIIITLHKEFSTLLGPLKTSGMTIIPITLFLMIMFNNFLGLFPFIFTSSSHLTFTLSLALPLWLSFMFFGWINNTTHMLAHLVPQGTPPALMSFMVCIEMISNVIRPITLSVRLAANMIAGHLLLTLLGNIGPSSSSMIIISSVVIAQLLLLTLEVAVAFIQSYVFAILSTLYSSEVV